MWKYPLEESLFEKFGKYTKIAGVIFIILGFIGILFPVFMTLATVTFIAWLMMFSGIASAYFTYISDKHDMMGWLKSFALLLVSVLMIFYPISGIGTVGLLMSIYFFIDAFASFSMALHMRPNSGWIWWMINAVFSLLIAFLFIAGWPLSSTYLIGLLVGFSLLFDGVSLLITGSIFKKLGH